MLFGFLLTLLSLPKKPCKDSSPLLDAVIRFTVCADLTAGSIRRRSELLLYRSGMKCLRCRQCVSERLLLLLCTVQRCKVRRDLCRLHLFPAFCCFSSLQCCITFRRSDCRRLFCLMQLFPQAVNLIAQFVQLPPLLRCDLPQRVNGGFFGF